MLSWTALDQAALPVRCGDLGIRSATTLTPSAFLALSSATGSILPAKYCQTLDSLVNKATRSWLTLGGVIIPSLDSAHVQRKWDEQVCSSKVAALVQAADTQRKARLLGVQATGSGAWLHALSSVALGLRLSNEELHFAGSL
jgi:hypothetical protein